MQGTTTQKDLYFAEILSLSELVCKMSDELTKYLKATKGKERRHMIWLQRNVFYGKKKEKS